MGKIEQQLRKIPDAYREKVFAAIARITTRDVAGMDRKLLRGYKNIFRVRVGNYRIIYHDAGAEITFKEIARRNENTYKNY